MPAHASPPSMPSSVRHLHDIMGVGDGIVPTPPHMGPWGALLPTGIAHQLDLPQASQFQDQIRIMVQAEIQAQVVAQRLKEVCALWIKS